MSYGSWRDGDYAGSDDMDSVLEYSRQFHQLSQPELPSQRSRDVIPAEEPQASSSTSETQSTVVTPATKPSVREHSAMEVRARIQDLDEEVRGCYADIETIQRRIQECLAEKQKLGALLEKASTMHHMRPNDTKGKGQASGKVNFLTQSFDWTHGLKARMKSVFGIKDFRLCQEGVCNANMDGRDIVCIMPTGGGKSLTYQLPALLMTGCTLVISPLISLMTDQILHLREAGVPAAMITSTTRESEKKQTLQRLQMLTERSINRAEKEIKLIYVTPERMSKDKSFRSLLQKVDNAGKLARIVIDEAHCVSQLGHDFRKDYKELHILRKIFPRVPIMALSATCGPRVLEDLISILGLKEVVPGQDAPPLGTVLFSSPLYRKNLHYRVVPKPDGTKEQYEVMTRYILDNHPNETGIIYCLSKKDTQSVAEQLGVLSEDRIKTGVYHADIPPKDKERLHEAWREGKIKVVCATIAFGMGIDKGDVRFVLHHSISKSLEGYYQETGRAGRDGKDADCVLFYRPQDASSLAATAAGDNNSEDKLHAMLRFAEELRRCRKVQFAEYFSHSQLSISSWSTAEIGALDRCGHCDNCSRDVDSIEKRDVTLPAWQLLKILQAVRQQGGRLTLGKLALLGRGGAKGMYEVGKGKKRQTENLKIDFDAVCGGPVDMSKTDIEHLIIKLTVQNFFQEEYQQTAYTINAYIAPGPMAARLNSLKRQAVAAGQANAKLEFDFVKPASKSKSRTAKRKVSDNEGSSKAPPKKQRVEEASINIDDMYESDGSIPLMQICNAEDSTEEEAFDWSFSMDEPPSRTRREPNVQKSDADVIDLSD